MVPFDVLYLSWLKAIFSSDVPWQVTIITYCMHSDRTPVNELDKQTQDT